MLKPKTGVIRMIGELLFVIIGLLILVLIAVGLIGDSRPYNNDHTQKSEGVILSIEPIGESVNSVNVTVRYSAEGKEYEVHSEERIGNYRVGDTVEINYHSEDPSSGYIARTKRDLTFLYFAILIFIIVGFVIFVISFLKNEPDA